MIMAVNCQSPMDHQNFPTIKHAHKHHIREEKKET